MRNRILDFHALKEKQDRILSRNELKQILGGSGTCGYEVVMEYENHHGGGTTSATYTNCGIDYETAYDHFVAGTEHQDTVSSHWCCDSCGSSSYCDLKGMLKDVQVCF